jgi:hypothetical protein
MSQIFRLFETYVVSILSGCCICFSLYIYVASVYCKYFLCFGCMLQQMLYVASVPSAGVATGRRRRWSPRAQRSPRVRGKQSVCDNRHLAQSCIHRHGSRCEIRSCIHGQVADAEHEAKRHSWAPEGIIIENRRASGVGIRTNAASERLGTSLFL